MRAPAAPSIAAASYGMGSIVRSLDANIALTHQSDLPDA
jgi:hypothetical protein